MPDKFDFSLKITPDNVNLAQLNVHIGILAELYVIQHQLSVIRAKDDASVSSDQIIDADEKFAKEMYAELLTKIYSKFGQ